MTVLKVKAPGGTTWVPVISGPKGETGSPGPAAGSVLSGRWQFSATANGYPPAGVIQVQTSSIWINEVDADLLDRSGALAVLQAGDQLLLRPASGEFVYQVLTSTKTLAVFEFEVELLVSTGSAPVNGADLYVDATVAPALPADGTIGNILEKTGNGSHDVAWVPHTDLLVLNAGQPVPPGTLPGTIIFRRT